jgi:hypothetical protein
MDVRSIIGVMAAGALTAGFFLNKVDGAIYVPTMIAAVAWWFNTANKEAKLKTTIKNLEDEKAKLQAPPVAPKQ